MSVYECECESICEVCVGPLMQADADYGLLASLLGVPSPLEKAAGAWVVDCLGGWDNLFLLESLLGIFEPGDLVF